MRILVTTPYLPSPPNWGGARRMHALVMGLAARHEVTLISAVNPPDDYHSLSADLRARCKEVVMIPNRGWSWTTREKRLAQLRSLFSFKSFEHRMHRVTALQEELDRRLAPGAFDAALVEFSMMACYDFGKTTKVVLDEHNIEYDILRRTAEAETEPLRKLYNAVNCRKLRNEEVEAWRRFQGVLVTSRRDLDLLHSVEPQAKVQLVPNAVDLAFFKPDPSIAPESRSLLFFGALNYYPNESGLGWFLDQVWPLLRKSHPDVKLNVVGQHPPESLKKRTDPGVTIVGAVPDLRPWLCKATATLAPLHVGGGTRLKILEAMAVGRPVVSTRIGAEGIDVVDGQHVLLGDDPEAFAAQVRRTLDDPALCTRLGAASRTLVEEKYGWDAAVSVIEKFFGAV